VWDEGSKEEGAQKVEIVYQQQTSEQKDAQIKGKVRGYKGGERVDEDVWVGALVRPGEWISLCDVQRRLGDGWE
jgi:hypothetical protein